MNNIISKADDGSRNVPSDVTVPDRWLLWPVILVLGSFFCLILICGIPGALGFLLTLLGLILVPVAALGLLITSGMSAIRRKNRRAFSFALAIIIPIIFLKPIVWATECVHVALTVGLGVGQSGLAARDVDGLTTYDWSVGLAGGPNTFLIYDQTDNISLPRSMHKWKDDGSGIGGDCAGRSSRLIDHYYLCSF